MKTINISLKNCYGINKFETEFDFKETNTVAIYAPNGVMKTSFANTFIDVSKKENPKERIHDDVPECKILTDGNPIDPEEICVIKSYQDKYSPDDSITTLLIDEESKKEYNLIYSEILKKKNGLIVKLNKSSGEKKDDIEDLLLKDFKENDFYHLMVVFNPNDFNEDFSEIKHSEIFDKDVLEFLKKPDVLVNINNY